MSDLPTERNKILLELLNIAEKPEHVSFLMQLTTEMSVDYIAKIQALKNEIFVMKKERDWMFNKILERVNNK